jgi:alpha/beta superfamily hydrolase
MHGNSSSRLEALSALSLVLSLGATLLAFDFAGSGRSEGEYVSLGEFEKDDLQVVLSIFQLAVTLEYCLLQIFYRFFLSLLRHLHGYR